jgi:uncharacterized protein
MASRALKQSEKRRRSTTLQLSVGKHNIADDLRPIVPLVERIVAQMQPEEIWLFGSRAEGRARDDSDYDLLAVLPNDAPESALDLVKAFELTCGLGVPADIQPCTRSEFEEEKNEVGTLASAAYHRGRRIYAR